jgi:hypothetical protein
LLFYLKPGLILKVSIKPLFYFQGQCYLETSNLDGETSLKTRVSPNLTRAARTIRTVSALLGCVECENPNPKLDSFLGRLTVWTGDTEDDVKVCSLRYLQNIFPPKFMFRSWGI